LHGTFASQPPLVPQLSLKHMPSPVQLTPLPTRFRHLPETQTAPGWPGENPPAHASLTAEMQVRVPESAAKPVPVLQ